jgi:sigma-E factor negative regulatory protein RseC
MKMKQQEFGVVIEVNGNVAKVKADRHCDCDNCGTSPGDSVIFMDVRNEISAKPGQKVAFEMHNASMVISAFVVFIIPLFTATAGTVIGWLIANRFGQPTEAFQVGGCIIGFSISLFIIKLYNRILKNNVKTLPVITKILN